MRQRDLDTRTRRRILKALLAAPAAAAFGPSLAQSQDYPNRPVKLVMPYAAGGAPELFIRPMQQVLSPRLGEAGAEYRGSGSSQKCFENPTPHSGIQITSMHGGAP